MNHIIHFICRIQPGLCTDDQIRTWHGFFKFFRDGWREILTGYVELFCAIFLYNAIKEIIINRKEIIRYIKAKI